MAEITPHLAPIVVLLFLGVVFFYWGFVLFFFLGG
jgi:hypothetical protein